MTHPSSVRWMRPTLLSTLVFSTFGMAWASACKGKQREGVHRVFTEQKREVEPKHSAREQTDKLVGDPSDHLHPELLALLICWTTLNCPQASAP